MKLFALAKKTEFKIFPLCGRKLTAFIHTSTKMRHNPIITVSTRLCLTTCGKMSVTILELTCAWHLLYTFKVYFTFIPSRIHLVQFKQRRNYSLFSFHHVFCLSHVNGSFIFKILHCSGFCLDNDKIHSGANLITFRVEYITIKIFTNVSLQHWIHFYFRYRTQKEQRFVNITDQSFFVKIS